MLHIIRRDLSGETQFEAILEAVTFFVEKLLAKSYIDLT